MGPWDIRVEPIEVVFTCLYRRRSPRVRREHDVDAATGNVEEQEITGPWRHQPDIGGARFVLTVDDLEPERSVLGGGLGEGEVAETSE
jgi:hypothetical protein